jgi:hypothetical protein
VAAAAPEPCGKIAAASTNIAVATAAIGRLSILFLHFMRRNEAAFGATPTAYADWLRLNVSEGWSADEFVTGPVECGRIREAFRRYA